MAKPKVTKMKDDHITVITNDIQRIRTRPTMIVGFIGSKGILHLCKEIINNNADECFKKESPGDTIHIEIAKDHIMSEDNGRGLPTDMLQIIHETSQAGSNMTREHGASAGENGIGTTAFTALASELIVTTFRPQEKKKLTLHYKEGKLVDKQLEKYDGKEHGLRTYFKPSKKIMGESDIPVDELVDWIKGFEYTLQPTTTVYYKLNGTEYKIQHKTIDKFFDTVFSGDDFLSQPIMFECGGQLKETVRGVEYDRMFHIEASFMYASPNYRGDDLRESWMNMIHTAEGGSHINGVINGLIKYLTERVIAKKKALAEDDLRRDILMHLNVAVKADCDFANIFASQEKAKVDSRPLGLAIANAVYKTLNGMISTKLNEIVDIVIQNNRVRKEGERVRNVTVESRKKQWIKPDEFLPCSTVKTVQGKELFLCEGKSARGGLDSARNALYQAILMFSGKPPGVWEMTLDEVLKSPVWLRLINTLGCGIGPAFDITKLRFEKVIIATDADVDGYHIRTIICSFFLRFMPELFEAGKIYIAEPPLYKLQCGKNVSYVASQTEYIEECIKTVGNMRLIFPGMDASSALPAKTFIKEAFNYLETLDTISVDRSINRYLLEHIANGFVKYGDSEGFINHINDWLRSLTKTYRELTYDYDTNQIIATIDYVDQVVILDDSLMIALWDIIEVQKKYGLIVEYDGNVTTLCRFFENVNKKYPVIKERYKGLGSSDAKVSREIIMNPTTRRIFRVDASDPEIYSTYSMLIGKGKENITARKEMIENFKWVPSDIDT